MSQLETYKLCPNLAIPTNCYLWGEPFHMAKVSIRRAF